MECLEKCYGQAFFQRFRDRGFKYLDILLRPHPQQQQRSGRNLDSLVKELEEALISNIAQEEAEAASGN
jgi:hypothetical protein